jgi:muconolactone delta-isomerase
MQFLSISRRRTNAFPPEAFTPELIAKEGQRVREMYATGILRQIWRRGDAPGAILLWEASSEDEVRAAIATLPLAKAGMIETAMLTSLEPYPGFFPAK